MALVQSNFSLTARQTEAVKKEAKKLQVSESEVVRRIFDAWLENKPGLANLYRTASATG